MNWEYLRELKRTLFIVPGCIMFGYGCVLYSSADALALTPQRNSITYSRPMIMTTAYPSEPELFSEMRAEIQAVTSPSFQKAFPTPIRISFGDWEDYPQILFNEACTDLLARPNSDFLRTIKSWNIIDMGPIVEIELHPIFRALFVDNPKHLNNSRADNVRIDKKVCCNVRPLNDPRRNFDWFQFTMAKIIHGLSLSYFHNQDPYEKEPRLKYYIEFFHRNIQIRTEAYFVPHHKMRYPIHVQEFASEAAFFATNAELFWLTNNFACRRPALYQYYSTLFPEMRGRLPCPLDDTMKLIGSHDLVRMNADYVWRVFYVHRVPHKGPIGSMLDSDHALSAAWGHSMLRVVLCESTDPKEQGLQCAHDSVPDFLITFNNNHNLSQLYSDEGARVKTEDDSTLPILIRGFMGGFFKEGLIAELRLTNYLTREAYDLSNKSKYTHYPVRMEKDEIQLMLYATLELYDQYFGMWHNLTNNCVAHLLRLMRSSMQTDPFHETPYKNQSNFAFTPSTFLRLLERSGQLDAPVREQITSDSAIHSHPGFDD